jgi:Ala-tRNA(Pro) deacylase
VSGSILSFSFHPELHLIAGPDLLVHKKLFFNAARLDRSVALAASDYIALARPRIEQIGDL